MELVLVSFALCPYLQRARLLLQEKGVPHEVRLIDLAKKPDWFKQQSTRGRVPMLIAGGEVIDEPDALLELLEELHPTPAFHASTPLARARDRALSRFAANEIFPTAYRLQSARDEDEVRSALRGLHERLLPLERALEHASTLSDRGARFGWADVALAPFGVRAALFKKSGFVDVTGALPALGAWVQRLVERPSVTASLPTDFAQLVLDDMAHRDSWLHQHPGAL